MPESVKERQALYRVDWLCEQITGTDPVQHCGKMVTKFSKKENGRYQGECKDGHLNIVNRPYPRYVNETWQQTPPLRDMATVRNELTTNASAITDLVFRRCYVSNVVSSYDAMGKVQQTINKGSCPHSAEQHIVVLSIMYHIVPVGTV